MIFYKIIFHINAILRYCFLKIIYGKKLKIGKGTTWRRNLLISIDNNSRISIGENCFFNNNCSLNSYKEISIGDNCIFGENVRIYDHNHRFNLKNKPIKEQGFACKKIKIGDNCWIGSNVLILKGANIGNNCVIGAGCVIKENILHDTIVSQSNSALEKKAIERI